MTTFQKIFALLVVFNIIDAWLTHRLLKSKAAVREGNPLMAAAMRWLGIDGALVAVKTLSLAVLYWWWADAPLEQIMWPLCAVIVGYCWICRNNYRLALKAGVV